MLSTPATARIVGDALGIEPIPDTGLRERNLGILQGLTKTQFAQQHPEDASALAAGDPDYVLPDGESARQRHDRCVAAASRIAAAHPGQTTAVVGHGGTIQSLLRHTLNIPLGAPRRFSLYNGSIARFAVDGTTWRLDTWGETAHLRGMSTLDDR